jgi:hypothetical protein
MVVADATEIMLDCNGLLMFERAELEEAIAEAAGADDQDMFECYHDPVLDQLNASEHPHLDGFYITEEGRNNQTLWADLDKAERTILLRRWAVAEAIQKSERQRGYSYTDVQEIFETNAMAGPSHQYAYDLMEAAADEPGFEYGKFSVGTQAPKTELRVDVSEVSEAILDWVHDECGLDADRIGVIADVTSYSAGPTPDQEAAADD